MNRTNFILWVLTTLACIISCTGKKPSTATPDRLIATEKQTSQYTDRSFFFLKEKVKEMVLSYKYEDNLLSYGLFRNTEGIKVNFDEQGFITRLHWKYEDRNYDFTFVNATGKSLFHGKGDPKLVDTYYYVIDSGMRSSNRSHYTMEIQLAQKKDGETVGSILDMNSVTFTPDGRMEKLIFGLFSDLLPVVESNGIEEKYEYRNETDDFPTFVNQVVNYGGESYSFNHEVKYMDIDEQGNWRTAKFSDQENGSLQLTITRTFIYY